MQRIIQGDVLEALRRLPSGFIHTCVTSPPYWNLRDYGVDGQIGLEATPEEYVEKLVEVFREVRRVLRDDGTLWLNLGDSYAGSGKGYGGKDHGKLGKHANDFLPKPVETPNGLKPKDLVGIPWRVAFALQADGWYLRSDIIWHKPNAMPESVKDRPTKAHEYIFLLSKSPRYYYDADAIREPLKEESKSRYKYAFNKYTGSETQTGERLHKGTGITKMVQPKGRNKRSVWTVATRPFKGAHFAVFPPDLIEPCILAGSPEKACPHCGAPWVRVTVNERGFDENGLCRGCGQPRSKHKQGKKSALRAQEWGKAADSTTMLDDGAVPCNANKTIGWKPTCQCENNDGSGKGIVLDPFFGSGTTGLVAQQHGRRWIGIELNPEYIEIAKKRLGEVATWSKSSKAIV